MKRLPALVLAVTVGLTACIDDPFQPQVGEEVTQVMSSSALTLAESGNALVVFKANNIPADFAARVEALGGNVELMINAVGAASVSGLDDAGLAALQADNAISSVGPEPLIEMPGAQLDYLSVASADVTPASQANPAASFFFPRQWHLRAIGADQAWAAGHLGSTDITVAILDTGIGYLHSDLAGLVDLSRSVSFATADDAFVQAFFPGAHLVADIGFHGTHVAATVASMGLSAAGVTSRTTLMGVKVCSVAQGFCPGAAIFAGIEHAVDNGADIINMSLGGAFLKRSNPGFVSVINRLFHYAHQQGVTVIVAAGNELADLDRNFYPNTDTVLTHFPSLYKTYCDTPHNICVSATGPTASAGVNGPWQNIDAPAPYTNFGRSAIDVAAPGGATAFVTAACSPFSLLQGLTICQTGTFVVGSRGTSMASPHVAGLAAMIMGQQGRLSPTAISAILRQTADDLGQPGTDPFYGKGRINAARALGVN
jgi:subtilisin family serine protease